MDRQKNRSQFSISEDIVYLNCSYMGPQLKSATQIGVSELARKETPWVFHQDDFFEHIETFQKLVAKLLHTKPEHIALVPSVGYGLSTAAAIVASMYEPGEVLLLNQQFPSNVYPWRNLKKNQFSVKTIERNLKADLTEQVLSAVSSETRVVAVGQCHWADGQMLDLEELGKELKQKSVGLVVDGIQSVGVVPTHVEASQVSVLAGGNYKWLLGPVGVSYIYVSPEFQSGPPIDSTWLSRVGANDFTRLTEYTDKIEAGAQKFQMGGRNFTQLKMANEGLRFLLNLGIENIQSEVMKMTKELAQFFEEKDCELIAEEFRAPHILAVKNPRGGWSDSFKETLIANKIYVSYRGDRMRISPNIYNTDKDLVRFKEVLQEAL